MHHGPIWCRVSPAGPLSRRQAQLEACRLPHMSLRLPTLQTDISRSGTQANLTRFITIRQLIYLSYVRTLGRGHATVLACQNLRGPHLRPPTPEIPVVLDRGQREWSRSGQRNGRRMLAWPLAHLKSHFQQGCLPARPARKSKKGPGYRLRQGKFNSGRPLTALLLAHNVFT